MPLVIVVSALQGVTDSLKNISEQASEHDLRYKTILDDLIKKHRELCQELLYGTELADTLSEIDQIFSETSETLSGLFLLRELSKFTLDKILSAGERLSSCIISSFFEDSLLIDSREMIKTDDNFGKANVDFNRHKLTHKEKALEKDQADHCSWLYFKHKRQ